MGLPRDILDPTSRHKLQWNLIYANSVNTKTLITPGKKITKGTAMQNKTWFMYASVIILLDDFVVVSSASGQPDGQRNS